MSSESTPCGGPSEADIVNFIRQLTLRDLPKHPAFAQARHVAFILGSKGLVDTAVNEYYKAIQLYEENPSCAQITCNNESSEGLYESMYRDFIPFCLIELGVLHTRHNNLECAVKVFDKAISILHNNIDHGAKAGDPRLSSRCLLVETKKHMASALQSGGLNEQACQLFQELLSLYRNGQYESRELYSDCCYHLGEILNSQGKFEDAEEVIRECVRIRRCIYGGIDSKCNEAEACSRGGADCSSDDDGECSKKQRTCEKTIRGCESSSSSSSSGGSVVSDSLAILTQPLNHNADQSVGVSEVKVESIISPACKVKLAQLQQKLEEQQQQQQPCVQLASSECEKQFQRHSSKAHAAVLDAVNPVNGPVCTLTKDAGNSINNYVCLRKTQVKQKKYSVDECRQYKCKSSYEIALALCLLAVTIAAPQIMKLDEAESSLDEALSITRKCYEYNSLRDSEATGVQACTKELDKQVFGIQQLLDSVRGARSAYDAVNAGDQDQDQDEEFEDDVDDKDAE